ncbi:MAG: hypothetical protein QY322_02715 [bacterium]|nr:MAG: hypothetical protein QY322_02715 [bacterium]
MKQEKVPSSKVLGYLSGVGIGEFVSHIADEKLTPNEIIGVIRQAALREAKKKLADAEVVIKSVEGVEAQAPNAGDFEKNKAKRLLRLAKKLGASTKE